MNRRAVLLSIGFPAIAWVFAGGFGLLVAGVIVAAWWTLAPTRTVLWAFAVGCLAAAPVALIVQDMIHGSASAKIAGALFGVQHLAAHRLVEAALAFAAFAGLVEGLRVRPPESARARTRALVAFLSEPAERPDEDNGRQRGGASERYEDRPPEP